MVKKLTLTPVMKQYLDMKAENPDAVLLFRLGDFYEAFFNDARIISKTLDLVLTRRGKDERGNDIPMCGIPWHAADNYFARLVKSGISVALAEQMETPEEAKARGHKQIERKVVRVMTAGTLTDDNLLNPKKSNFLVAVAQSKTSGYCFSGCDISTGEFFIGETINLFDDISKIAPAEIIYPEKLAETLEIVRLREHFTTTPVYEKLYSRTDIDAITNKILPIFNTPTLSDKLLAAYLNNTQRDTNIIFRTPYRFGVEKQLLIDLASWKSLEIDSVLNEGGTCLLDILDKTHTAAGARKLRIFLRQLSGDIREINRRQEHITYLLSNTQIFKSMSDELSKLPDVGRAITRLISGRGTPRDLHIVSDFLNILPTIKSIGEKLDLILSAKFKEIKTFNSFALELDKALSDNMPAFFRDGEIINDGFDDVLDNMRQMAHGAKKTIALLQAEYIKKTGINALKIKFNNILGYHIEVPNTRADVLMRPESGFIHRQTMVNNMRFTTAHLIDLDNEVRGAADKAAAIEAEIIAQLIEKIREISDELLQISDLIAETDVWLALTKVAYEYDWVRPTMTNGNDFEIIAGRHPVIESILNKSGNQFIKNNCNLNDKKIALLTGPNMAGKSTYLRQNALITILAHMGSFVPAESATIGICDQLFSRVGASDNLAAGQSTFMVEMQETANILNRATNKSFIIFDEIGRGTATWDGMAIAQAVLEFLNELKPRTLFATHYHELTKIPLNELKNLNVQIAEHDGEIIFLHKIASGFADRSYGIHVAQMAGMPDQVISRAKMILKKLENNIGQQYIRENLQGELGIEKPSDVFISRDKDKKPAQLSLFGE
ncbi:MAG: DNA mismatch repair protein MutS [Alphaproteobacteria bacterium]|jgi:DNA mismatch repair protein MutS